MVVFLVFGFSKSLFFFVFLIENEVLDSLGDEFLEFLYESVDEI